MDKYIVVEKIYPQCHTTCHWLLQFDIIFWTQGNLLWIVCSKLEEITLRQGEVAVTLSQLRRCSSATRHSQVKLTTLDLLHFTAVVHQKGEGGLGAHIYVSLK